MNTKTLFRWHLWLGLVTGAFLFVVGGSGSVAVFIEEIDWLVTPALRAKVPEGAKRVGPDALVASIRAAYPEDRLTVLNLSERPSFAHVAKVQSKSRGSLDVFLDPVTGRIQGDREYSGAYTSTARNFIRQLHLRLFMGLWGRVFVGFFGVTLVLSCITGLWIYRGWIKNLFRLRWGASGPRTRWSDLHKIVGVWSLAANILFGVTGAVYGYENLVGQVRSHWLRPRATAENPPAPRPARPVSIASAARVDPLSLDAVLERARVEFPDLTVRNILFPANAGGTLSLRGDVPSLFVNQSHVRRSSGISFDATGAVRQKTDAREATGWSRVYLAFDPLHFGYIGGTPTKILWFILGLAPGVLSLTGAWLWWRRTRALPSRHKPAAPAPARASFVVRCALAASALTLLGAYVLVARAQKDWSLTGKLIEHALAKPVALALTVFPVTGLLLWLAARAAPHRGRFALVMGLFGAWYLTLTTLFQ